MRCAMGFLLAGILTFIPLVVQAKSLDDADDSDVAFSAITSLSARDGSDNSLFGNVGLSRNYRLAWRYG